MKEALSGYRISPFFFLGGCFLSLGAYFFIPSVGTSHWAISLSVVCAWLAAIQFLNRYAPFFSAGTNRSIRWLHAMTFEGFAIAGILFSYLSRFLGFNRQAVKGSPGRPILLVPGYFNNSTVWLYQKKQLEEAGLGPIYAIDLGYPFDSIEIYAQKVAEKAKEIAQETGREDLVLIGYSMGGLVSAWYALHLAPSSKVTDLITIASPFGGTPIARIGIGANSREMECGSEFTRKIRKKIESNRQIRFYQIASASDELVFPGIKTALLGNHPERQFVLEDLGHAGLIYSKRVSQKICSWLKASR